MASLPLPRDSAHIAAQIVRFLLELGTGVLFFGAIALWWVLT